MRSDLIDSVRELIARDRLDPAMRLLTSAPGLDAVQLDELAILGGKLQDLERSNRLGAIDRKEYVQARGLLAQSVLEVARLAKPEATSTPKTPVPTTARPSARAVFLSYNHGDRETALALKAALESASIPVRMDVVARSGQDIRGFILDSIRETDATICIISEASLLSGWVATETVLALGDSTLWGRRTFIGCYLDERFLDPRFRLQATERIDAHIGELDRLIVETMAKRLDIDDLNGEKSRLHQLRHHLGAILQRLRESLCLDIREPCFSRSVELLVDELSIPAAAVRERA